MLLQGAIFLQQARLLISKYDSLFLPNSSVYRSAEESLLGKRDLPVSVPPKVTSGRSGPD